MLKWSIRRCSAGEVSRSDARGDARPCGRASHESRRPLTRKVSHAIPAIEWPFYAGDIDAIMTLKRERNAVMLAHNYQTPEIFHCVADIVGDSLALAREAMNVDADVIVLAGVHFMAETAKLLNPEKTVLIPDLGAGCSLAEFDHAARTCGVLRQRYPGVPIVTYVNTSAAVKAESDICCTSGNAQGDRRIAGRRRASSCCPTNIWRTISRRRPTSRSSPGRAIAKCMSASPPPKSRELREDYPGVVVLAHPECPPEVVAEADFSGSTAAMTICRRRNRPQRVGAAHRMLDERQCRRAISRSSNSCGPAISARI